MPTWKLPFVVKSFTSLMRQNAASISLFEDVDNLLRYLADRAVTLAIVSSNSHENVSRILGPENTKLISQFEGGVSILANLPDYRRCSKRLAFPVAKSSISAIKLQIWRRRVRKKLLLEPCHGGTERLNRSEHILLKRSSIVLPPSKESPNCLDSSRERYNGRRFPQDAQKARSAMRERRWRDFSASCDVRSGGGRAAFGGRVRDRTDRG
jgi:hypothetical protein